MNYAKELTVFRGQKRTIAPPANGRTVVRVISEPQHVKLTQFDETGGATTAVVTSRESGEQRPIWDRKQDSVVDELPVSQYEPSDFSIVKPLHKDCVYLDMQWGRGTVPIMLPREFFTSNEPLEILTGAWRAPEPVGPVVEPGPPYEGEPADLDNTMVMTEVPADVVREAGLSEGPNDLDAVYDKKDFLKSLCNNAIGGGAGGVVNNMDLLKEFFPGKKFYLKQYNGKYFVVFKGMAGTRTTLRGTRYALKNPKVMALSAAKGPGAGAGAAARGLKPVLKGNILTVAVIGVVDLVAWQQGMLSDDGKFISDFIVEFGMDVAKAAVSAIVAGVIVGLGCMAAAWIGVAALPVVVVVGAGIAISIAFGMLLDYIDETTGITAGFRNRGNDVEKTITKAFNERLIDPICQTLYQLERHIEWLHLRNVSIPFPR